MELINGIPGKTDPPCFMWGGREHSEPCSHAALVKETCSKPAEVKAVFRSWFLECGSKTKSIASPRASFQHHIKREVFGSPFTAECLLPHQYQMCCCCLRFHWFQLPNAAEEDARHWTTLWSSSQVSGKAPSPWPRSFQHSWSFRGFAGLSKFAGEWLHLGENLLEHC